MKPYSLPTKRQQELRLRLSLDLVKTQGVFDFKAITHGGPGRAHRTHAISDTVYFYRENGLMHEVDGKPFITSKGKRLVARPSNLDSLEAHQQ
jgi:hypothetical protein